MDSDPMARPHSPQLDALRAFSDGRRQYFAQGFECVDPQQSRHVTAGWSDAPEWQRRLTPVGLATTSGSVYAQWAAQDGSHPVVVLGDEGGVRVVAQDVADLLRLLSLDAEPMVSWDEVDYYFEDDHTPGHAEYVAWLREVAQLEPIAGNEEAEEIVALAHERHGAELARWVAAQGIG